MCTFAPGAQAPLPRGTDVPVTPSAMGPDPGVLSGLKRPRSYTHTDRVTAERAFRNRAQLGVLARPTPSFTQRRCPRLWLQTWVSALARGAPTPADPPPHPEPRAPAARRRGSGTPHRSGQRDASPGCSSDDDGGAEFCRVLRGWRRVARGPHRSGSSKTRGGGQVPRSGHQLPAGPPWAPAWASVSPRACRHGVAHTGLPWWHTQGCRGLGPLR